LYEPRVCYAKSHSILSLKGALAPVPIEGAVALYPSRDQQPEGDPFRLRIGQPHNRLKPAKFGMQRPICRACHYFRQNPHHPKIGLSGVFVPRRKGFIRKTISLSGPVEFLISSAASAVRLAMLSIDASRSFARSSMLASVGLAICCLGRVISICKRRLKHFEHQGDRRVNKISRLDLAECRDDHIRESGNFGGLLQCELVLLRIADEVTPFGNC